MADVKVSALTSLSGAPTLDDLLYLVDAPGTAPASRKVTVGTLLQGGYGENVLHHGALGNSSHGALGGNDDTAEIQEAYTVAYASGGSSLVTFPGRRTYRITSTITVPEGVVTAGLGGYDGAGEGPPTIVWEGNATDPMFLVSSADTNIFTTSFHNVCIRGSAAAANLPTAAVRFERSGGGIAKIDSGTYFDNCWIQKINGNGVDIVGKGATNFYWIGGRFDNITNGHCIYVDLTQNGAEFIGQILNGTSAAPGRGLLHLDGNGVSTVSGSIVSIIGWHSELDSSGLEETFASGSNPFDKRGIIRLSVVGSLSYLQHRLSLHGCTFAYPGSTGVAHSIIQITAASGTDADASDAVLVTMDNCNNISDSQSGSGDAGTTGEVRAFGGKVPAIRRFPFPLSNRSGRITWGQGRDNNSEGIRSFSYQRPGSHLFRGHGLLPETYAQATAESALSAGALAYITDALVGTIGNTVASGGSAKVLCMYNGSAWKIIAAI